MPIKFEGRLHCYFPQKGDCGLSLTVRENLGINTSCSNQQFTGSALVVERVVVDSSSSRARQRFFVGEGFIAFATSHLGHGLKMQAHLHQTRILLKIQMIMSQ